MSSNMFNPKYSITNKLLNNIKQINSLIIELNSRKFPRIVLYQLEKEAREVSVFTSTSIEGNPLPLTDVKRILKSKPINLRTSEQEVVNYNQALISLNQNLLKKKLLLHLNLILSIHKQTMEKLVPEYQLGRIRNTPVFVNDPKIGRTVFWPPDAKDIPNLLNSLIEFINKNKEAIDPLILAGIFHKEFVIIHPFTDGNGRTVRLATKVLLAGIGLNTFNLFSFENYYNNNVTSYFNYVGAKGNYYDIAGKIDFTAWLEYFSDGIMDELLRVKKTFPITVTPKTEILSHHEKILKAIREKDYITDKDYARLTDRAKATRNLDFNRLIKMGKIERKGKGRATYYIISYP